MFGKPQLTRPRPASSVAFGERCAGDSHLKFFRIYPGSLLASRAMGYVANGA
jgi:hypothetical protein